MRQLEILINKKLYYTLVFVAVSLIMIGTVLAITRFHNPITMDLCHIVLAFVFSVCLFVYPLHETHRMRIIMVTVGIAYFYMFFFLYPEEWSTFVFICFIPIFSIVFFDVKLFYLSFLMNGMAFTITLVYFKLATQGNKDVTYLMMDLAGSIINFIASQVIVLFIFYFTVERIKKQQYYYDQMQDSERLRSTGELAAAVAHEIRNPLTVVRGFLQFYEGDASVESRMKQNFSLMINELDTAEHVISQFLAIARPHQDKEVEKVDVKEALQSVTDLLQFYGILHNNHIHLHAQEQLYIGAHMIEFKQLMINLIKNAIEASGVGDSIAVGAAREDGHVEIQLVDSGCGMSEEALKSLGTPFYSLKSKGTGLGMMICFRIVERYKGTIRFRSSEGQGTTVIIRFPLYHE